MTGRSDLDRRLDTFLRDDPTELPDPSFDAIRDGIDHTRQRAVLGPWRVPDIMSRVTLVAGSAIALVLVIVVGSQLFAPGGIGGAGATPSPTAGAIGGTVSFTSDRAPATTTVDAVADGTGLSGTAVTTFATGTHTVRLECAKRDGNTWALAGTSEQTTIPGEKAGDWSAVTVRDGSPQQIAIWISDDKTAEASDCAAWLGLLKLDDIGAENFVPVESGELVPPPAVAP